MSENGAVVSTKKIESAIKNLLWKKIVSLWLLGILNQHAHTHTHEHMYTHTHTHIHTHTNEHMYIYTHTYIHTHTRILGILNQTRAHTHTHTYVCMSQNSFQS